MRSNDPKLHAGVNPSHHGSVPSLECAALGDPEPHATPGCSDLVEPFGVNWESAWIDLGGEG
jgi:hypothetical protein